MNATARFCICPAPEERWHYQRSVERTEITEESPPGRSPTPVSSVPYVPSTGAGGVS